MRKRRRGRKDRDPSGHLGLGCIALISLTATLMVLAGVIVYTTIVDGLPPLTILPHLLDPPDGLLLQPTRVYDRTGEKLLLSLENPGANQREFLTLDETQENFLPPSLVLATIAASDPSFWRNPGFSMAEFSSGGRPTLAQQLVSDLMLWDQPHGMKRALQERLLAAQITRRYGREQLLTWYLNSAYYGRLVYGANTASHVYFGKPAVQLSLAESALLAATADAPALNPHDAPEVARQRAKSLLDSMLKQGLISKEQAQNAKDSPLSFKDPAALSENPAPAFVSLALEEASETIPLNRLERGGYEITTTLDYELQRQSTCAADIQLMRIHASSGESFDIIDEGCQAAYLLPTLTQRMDVPPQNLGVDIAILDPSLGQLLALTDSGTPFLESGGSDKHPLGTLITPFIYLTGFTRGLSPGSLVWDIPSAAPETDISNPDGRYHGPVRLRTAMANDYLSPAAQVMTQVGPENVRRTAIDFGLASIPPAVNGSVPNTEFKGSLLEISHAYSVIANMGSMAGRITSSTDTIEPISLLQIEDASGVLWYELRGSVLRPIITPQLAYLVNHVLSDEAARWPSLGHPNALEIGRPAAAKIGRTASAYDTWTLGYTPQLMVGIWIGNADSHSLTEIHPQAAAGLWHAVAQYATRELPASFWERPPGISEIEVCDPSGMLPSPDCPTTVSEIFPAGSEPTQTDSLYRSLQINRETGRLATIFTSPEMIEERVYLMVPPEAVEWARQSGLPTPPDEYDIIPGLESSPGAQISSPEMFEHVRGEISIFGSATAEDFSHYRLQAGKGLNPQQWLLLDEEMDVRVSEGELARWNTEGLNGLYVIQLQVIHQDQGIDLTAVQVTVDNTPPRVNITYPSDGQEFGNSDSLITFRGQAWDNLELTTAQFYLDRELVATVDQPPFATPAFVTPGDHILRMVGTDKAGNTSEDLVRFSISK